MNLLALWPWGLGLLGVLLAVGVALSPVRALQLARELGAFALDKARDGIKRLREVRNWWRVASLCLAMVCVGFAFAIADAKRQIVVVRSECQTRVVEVERQAELAIRSATSNRAALQQCKQRLEDEVGKAVEAQRMAREAKAAADATAARAEADRAAWERTYRAKPASCEAALAAMEAACPTLADF